jgi:hypothetical protein
MTHDEESKLAVPVRTRGSLRTSTASGALQTRGAVRTRGGITPPPLGDLPGLIRDLRKAASDIPLTFVIHGWDAAPAMEFRNRLDPCLWPEDAVWLIPQQKHGGGEMKAGLVLNPDRPSDRRTYDNLVADLVFFSAAEASDAERAAHWAGRTEVTVASSKGAFAGAVLGTVERGFLFP